MKKPDPAFFSKLIDQYHILPERAIMVGNDGVCDIEGAKRTGLSKILTGEPMRKKAGKHDGRNGGEN